MRCLPELAAKLTAEVRGGEMRGLSERGDVQRIAIPSVDQILGAKQMPRRVGMGHRASIATLEAAATISGMQLTAAITHEAPWYVARCLDVEVASQGETVDEALDNLREALELYFEDAPMPDLAEPPIITTVEIAA